MTDQAIVAPVVRAARPNFLTLTPVCILVGIGVAMQRGVHVSVVDATLVLAGALLAHVCVNMLNEYADFRSGLDLITVRTRSVAAAAACPRIPKRPMPHS